MSFRLITTCFAMLFFVGGFLAAGCGGGDSPTSPPTSQPSTPTPTPPPAPTVSTIEISPNTASLEVGRTQGFVATAKASDGSVIGGVNFTWSSSNTAVVTINSAGVATAVSAGTATIRATGNGITSAPATITVTVAAVARVTIAPSSTQELMVGEMVTFTATARTAGGAIRGDASIAWASSDTSVVTITSAGVATAVGAGTAMVRASADGIASSPVTINVADPEPMVSTVTVSPASMMITVGGMFQFMATAMTDDGMVIEEAEFTWMSDDTEVATVDETGLVTTVAAGTAMITATASGVTSMPATVTVVESAPEVDSVEIVDAMPLMLETGDTHQLMAVARTSDGTMIGDVTFAWSSDDNGVATVDSTGLVTAVGAGMTDITAMTEETTSEPVSVTVAEPPDPPDPPDPPAPPDPPDPPDPPEPMVASVAVSPSSTSIEEGDTKQFFARALDSDNMEITGKTFTWTSSNTTVASINSSGLATAKEAGSTTIKAEVDGKSGETTLTVTAPPPPPQFKSRTATISGSYSAAGNVTLSEVAGGQLKLTITGFRSTAPDTWLALSETANIDWAVGETLPSTARSFGEVTGMTSITRTFTPPSGKDIDSYDYIILYCRAFDLRISSNALSN